MMFLDCPAYLDHDGTQRCGLPAEVRCRFTMHSTDGPLESAMIKCPAGHYFCGAIESLTWRGKGEHDPGNAAAEPERDACRPNTAPAYYLGYPAALWISAMRPRRRRTASRYPTEVAVSDGNPIPDSGVLQHS